MKFLLTADTSRMEAFDLELSRSEDPQHLTLRESCLNIIGSDTHTRIYSYSTGKVKAWIIGDPIMEKKSEGLFLKYIEECRIADILQAVGGHYWLILHNSELNEIHISSALFGILPVIYCKKDNTVCISNDLETISDHSGLKQPNKRFILENLLFYYPLFNQTAIKNISLLPANCFLSISSRGVTLHKHTEFADWMVADPIPWKKSIERVSDLFIERVQHYLPDEPYVHALTGGFDSRTLVSCGLHYRKEFTAYSFGNDFSEDSNIAAELSAKAGIKYKQVMLDQDYVEHHSLPNGLEFIRRSAGTASFSRAHYLFAAKKLSPANRYMVTGNFGSEILRAAHNAGVMISPNLYAVFRSQNLADAVLTIEASAQFNWINRDYYREEWEELKNDLGQLTVFNSMYSGLTLNAKFYLFVFEEVFRKYFGAEMVNQYEFLNNRTPFLDISFLREILKTSLAGVYSDFFEHNPLKRYKGQLLYSSLIKKTYSPFADIKTDKGYSPADLRTIPGKGRILMAFINKKIKKEHRNEDPFSLIRSYHLNKSFLEKIGTTNPYFNTKKIEDALYSGMYTDDLGITLSQAWFNDKMFGNK